MPGCGRGYDVNAAAAAGASMAVGLDISGTAVAAAAAHRDATMAAEVAARARFESGGLPRAGLDGGGVCRVCWDSPVQLLKSLSAVQNLTRHLAPKSPPNQVTFSPTSKPTACLMSGAWAFGFRALPICAKMHLPPNL